MRTFRKNRFFICLVIDRSGTVLGPCCFRIHVSLRQKRFFEFVRKQSLIFFYSHIHTNLQQQPPKEERAELPPLGASELQTVFHFLLESEPG